MNHSSAGPRTLAVADLGSRRACACGARRGGREPPPRSRGARSRRPRRRRSSPARRRGCPGMPAKNSAGPKPHFTHCRAMRAHGTPASAWIARGARALQRAERAMRRDHRAAHSAVAHQQVAAEADPQRSACPRGSWRRNDGEIHDVARREEQVRGAADVPGGVLGHGHVVQDPCGELRRGRSPCESLRRSCRAPPRSGS